MQNERPIIIWGCGGHESEYVLNIPPYDINDYIPMDIQRQLQALLPTWDVCNRGSRIELTNKQTWGVRDDKVVYPAVFQVLGIFDVALPTLDVLDQDGNIVNCAIVRERDHCWDLKPVEGEEFDAKAWMPDNTAFHMAWWRVAKNDKSAEPSSKTFCTRGLHRLVMEKAMPVIAHLPR